MLLEALEDTDNAEMRAIAVAHEAAHRPRKDDALTILANPFAVGWLRRSWQYKAARDGETVRILRYKGEGPVVDIPPRIGHRTVTEIAEDAFFTPEARQQSKGSSLYGGPYQYASSAVTEPVYDSVSFPGTIRVIPLCLGNYGGAYAKEIVLQDGIAEIDPKAFAGMPISAVAIPESVGKIGAKAFQNCTVLAKVNLPADLREIPAGLFAGCTALKEVRIPPALEKIGDGAFRKTALSSIDVHSVKQIGDGVFNGCDRLTDVALPEHLGDIPPLMFAGCKALTAMSECSSLTEINTRAFSCTGIGHVHLGVDAAVLGKNVFEACTKLRTVQIDGRMQTIPVETFHGCTALESVTLPETLHSIGKHAFRGCTSLSNINLPDSLENIGAGAFRNSGLTHLRVRASWQLGSHSFAACARLRAAEIEEGRTDLPSSMFVGCSALREVQFPASLELVGQSAFRDTGLQRVVLPAAVREIDDRAFSGCKHLQKLVLPDQGTGLAGGQSEECVRIGAEAFRGAALDTLRIPPRYRVAKKAFAVCPSLREVHIGAGIRTGDSPFAECASLEKVVLADGTAEVPARLCADCTGLREVQVPDTAAKIGEEAFRDSGLIEFEIPPQVKEIARGAFAGTRIRRIVIPATVESIGEDTFRNCCNLEEVVLPDTMRSIPPGMFAGCKSLRSMQLPRNLREIGVEAFAGSGHASVCIPGGVRRLPSEAFVDCDALVDADLGHVRSIGREAFGRCRSLAHIVLPYTLVEIDAQAFERSGLESIRIPASVRVVGKDAFRLCANLAEVEIANASTRISSSAFLETPVRADNASPIETAETTQNGTHMRWDAKSGSTD